MKHGYISKVNSAKEFQEHLKMFEHRGVPLDNVVVNVNFDEYIASLKDGDTVVVCSYVGLFPSLGAFLTTVVKLMGNGIAIESLFEPNLVVDTSSYELIRQLSILSRTISSTSSIISINKSRNEGKKLGRPSGSGAIIRKKVAQAEKLCKESNITIAAACRMVDCNQKTYYRLRSKDDE